MLVLLLIALAVFGRAAVAAAADAPGIVQLKPSMAYSELSDHLVFRLEDEGGLASAYRAYLAGGFTPDLATAAKDQVPYQPVWAAVEITNDTPDDGRTGDSWFLTSQVYGLVGLDVSVVRHGGPTEEVLSYSARRAFQADQFAGTRLRSAAIVLAPDETATLMLKMVFGPVRQAAFRLETAGELQSRTFLSGVLSAVYYAFALSSILFFLGFVLSMGSLSGVGYGVALILGLSFLAYLDGFFFRFVYPDHPDLHLKVGLFLLLACAGTGTFVAGRSVSEEKGNNRTALILKALAAIPFLAIALIGLVPPEILANLSYGLMVMMFAANVVAASHWRGIEGRWRTVIHALFPASLAFCLVLVVLYASGWLGAVLDPGLLVKAFFGVIALWVILGNTASIVDLRRQHAATMAREIDALRREADANRERMRAQDQYMKARDLAALRQQQLVTASHDLKQPLASLRMTVDTLARDSDPAVRAQLNEAFDYMRSLSTEYLAATGPERDEDAADTRDADEADDATIEIYPLSLVFETVARMFRDEAVSKGIDLRVVPTSAQSAVPFMAVMRIVSNLVSNAVKHTDRGAVLIGARHRQGRTGICIADQGAGMSREQLARFRKAYVKGDQSRGHGLGLSIAFDLAGTHGLVLDASSVPGCGTIFHLWLPIPAGMQSEAQAS
ncbi:sensor histidine kinase [Zhengella mangrovi]|uniref:sensor histidine kinase n=1 Tax=Zhengella mangrovi TaxID=1982044 RepID=UPI0010552A75|nr:sensor histidine kinase [Zhengella mangrovi]